MGNTDEERNATRIAALSAVDCALKVSNGDAKDTLFALWKPKPSSPDNDLAVFAEDDEFKKLLEPTPA